MHESLPTRVICYNCRIIMLGLTGRDLRIVYLPPSNTGTLALHIPEAVVTGYFDGHMDGKSDPGMTEGY